MKEIVINKMVLENFKCHKSLTVDFNCRDATIYGGNGTGKSSIYDALTWLLFGRYSSDLGEKSVCVKPVDSNGNIIDHHAETSVEIEFRIDGEAKTFRRTLREIWTTRRGSSEPVYDGNASDYYVDGVPTKKNGFDAAIREMVGEELFRMLTSVSWFSSGMKWQERRAILFDMAGTMTDAEIMAGNPDFAELRESMGKLSMDDYRRKLQHERKQFVGARDDAPARLSECEKTIGRLGNQDFEAARAESETLHARFGAIANEIAAAQNDTAVSSVVLEIRKAQMHLEQMEAENRQYRAAQGNRSDITALEQMASVCTREISMLSARIKSDEREAERCNANIAELRAKWVAVNGEAFAGGKCPTCGQALPFEILQAKTESFNADKAKRLQAIQDSADSMKQKLSSVMDEKAAYEKELEAKENELAEISGNLEKLNGQAATVTDMPDYGARRENILADLGRLEAEKKTLQENLGGKLASLKAEQADIRCRMDALSEIVAGEAVLTYTRQRMEQIREDARNASAALDAIDKMLYKCEEFVRYKAQFCEDSINSLFERVEFRLFKDTNVGGLEERCDVTLNGVPFLELNDAGKVTAGLDIINGLSSYYGVRVPVFVDRMECYERLIAMNCQVIRLEVDKNNRKLRVEL